MASSTDFKKLYDLYQLLGPVLNMTISDYVNMETGQIGSDLAPYTVWQQTNGKTTMKAWVGFTAGVRF